MAMPTKSEPSRSDGCKSCKTYNNISPIISKRLGNLPSEFFMNYPPGRASNIIAKGYTPGEVAMLPDTPTLADVEAKFGNETAVFWIKTLIDSVNMVQGAAVYPEEARNDIAALITSTYKGLNIGEFLLFFARYRLGDYTDLPVGGLQKISAALRRYVEHRNLDIRRIEREQYNRQQEAMRREWDTKAITYEEYLKTKEK